MNTTFRSRFMVVTLLMGTTLFTACKKDNVEPAAPADVATQAAGKYTYSEIAYNGKTVPASESNLKGTIIVARETESTVTVDLDIRQKSNNAEFMVLSADDIDVIDKGSGNLSLSYDGQEIGKLSGKKITINGEDSSNVRFTLSATK